MIINLVELHLLQTLNIFHKSLLEKKISKLHCVSLVWKLWGPRQWRSPCSLVVWALKVTFFFSGYCNLLWQSKHLVAFLKEPWFTKLVAVNSKNPVTFFNVAPEELWFKIESLLIPMATTRSVQLMLRAVYIKPRTVHLPHLLLPPPPAKSSWTSLNCLPWKRLFSRLRAAFQHASNQAHEI